MSISAHAADDLLTSSLTLVHRLPGTLAALEAGALHPGHLWTMLDKVGPIEDPAIRAEVEAELLRWAAGRVVSPGQLNDKARREVLKRDARAAARRLREAIERRGIHLRPDKVDGMATLTVVATMPEAQALYRALSACAESLDADDDPRTRGQKMVDCLLDLVLRPGENDLPPVQVLLTVVASIATLAGGDAPGEIDGQVVPAELIRQFLTALAASSSADLDRDDGSRTEPAAAPVPWQQEEADDLERWWAETERRVLADELAAPDLEAFPDPAPGDLGPGADAPAGSWDLSLEPVPDEAPGAAGDLRPSWPSDDPPLDLPSPSPTGTGRSQTGGELTDGTGWWATADRAVDDAGQAVLRADQALAHARRTVRTASRADAADEEDWQTGPGGRLTDAEDALAALRSATEAQREALAGLLATTGGGGLAERPRIALTDALSGALVALTDLPGLRRAGRCARATCRRGGTICNHDLTGVPGLGPPGPTHGYRPSAALDRWVRARDRRCRFPGCRRRVPRGGELDHDRRYPDGPTSAGNLVGYCTTDHRGKHQAPGWVHRLEPDGTLTVTTPTGLVAVTSPPPF
jgi:hypothetical protein